MGELTVQIGGKFSTTDDGIFRLKQSLIEAGVQVRHPRGDMVKTNAQGMALSVDLTHEGISLFDLEIDYLRCIRSCTAHVVHNKIDDQYGYVGESASVEMGYAMLAAKPIFLLYPPVYAPSVPSELLPLLSRTQSYFNVYRLDLMEGIELRTRIAGISERQPDFLLTASDRQLVRALLLRLLRRYRSSGR